jgi:hypothetical protein
VLAAGVELLVVLEAGSAPSAVTVGWSAPGPVAGRVALIVLCSRR